MSLLFALVPAVLLGRAWKDARGYVLLCTLGYCLHVARIGGDYQYFHRYLVPLIPSLAALTADGAIRLWQAAKPYGEPRRLAAAIAAIAVGAIGYYSERPVLDLLGLNDRTIARLPVATGDRTWNPGHMRGDAAETLRRRPDVIVLPVRPTEAPRATPGEAERSAYPFIATLLETPEFERLYRLEAHALPDGRWMNVYRLRNEQDD